MKLVFDSILESMRKYPSKIAIIDKGINYSFQDLDEYSEKIALYLSRYQVKQDSKVALFMRRSFDLLATLIAVWKQGATYIPIDPKTPSQRLRQLLQNIEATCVVCDPSLLNLCPLQEISALTLYDVEFAHLPLPEKAVVYPQAQLAYMIYTSGSTGEPKGVMITHKNLSNHINWLVQDFNFSAADCFSFNSSMAFDFTVACTLIPLSVGASIVICSEVDALNIGVYCQQLEKFKVTFAKWTPSYFRLITDYVEHNSVDLSSFRYIMVAGEELLTSYAERWFDIYPSHTLINEYGPTEAAVGITTYSFTRETINKELKSVPIGKPAINSTLYIVDENNSLVKDGEIGELLIGGASVALGYYKQPELTSQRFINNPFDDNYNILYRTGDYVKRLPDGNYLYYGRIDNQVKVNGYRVELNEIEHYILQNSSIKHAKLAVEKESHEAKIFAYLVLKENTMLEIDALKNKLSKQLPSFMIPHQFYQVKNIPMNRNGKVDYSALKQMTQIKSTPIEEYFSSTIELLNSLIKKYTGSNKSINHTSFFNLGLSSLALGQLVVDLNEQLSCALVIQDLFTYPTIAALAAYIDKKGRSKLTASVLAVNNKSTFQPIAIIAMDCRLPGADNCELLWEICLNEKETIEQFFPQTQMEASSAGEKKVYARGTLNNIDYFDAGFFGFSAKDAHLTDPQCRLLIESAWNAFEKAGYIPEQEGKKTGVYISTNDSTYVLNHHLVKSFKPEFSDRFALQRLMSPQCYATKIAYTLNCTGPSMTIQSACSGSLVAIVLACQQLSNFECDIALAGGVSITTPQHEPYTFQSGNIFSPDGHCRPFDAQAEGTVFSNGLGTIVLKRLEDALRDNDTIISVIKGVSINNDGSQKMSFSAPSVQGQMDCILSAQQIAGVKADSIQYVETHGTGTLVGDPIEIEALTQAFRQTTSQQQFCAIGSLKANIGHTHVAAGVAGLIKTSLALKHQLIPASINFETGNPHIDWENSPFYVNKRLQRWPKIKTPRRAAVSAFGVGGTNAHVIVEEAPLQESASPTQKPFILLLSAKSTNALNVMKQNLIQFLRNNQLSTDSYLADIAYTLQTGRKNFEFRTGLVCNSFYEAINALEMNYSNNFFTEANVDHKTKIIFMFPGGYSLSQNFAENLYENEPAYKHHLDLCLDIASRQLGCSLKEILFPVGQGGPDADSIPKEFALPLLFCIEYALAQLLQSWGVKPDVIFGHGVGEYVAACLAEIWSLNDAIKFICTLMVSSPYFDSEASREIQIPVSPPIKCEKPRIPFFSNAAGKWINNACLEFCNSIDDEYIQLQGLMEVPNAIYIEVGPGKNLLSLLKKQPKNFVNAFSLSSDKNSISNFTIAHTLQLLWCHGISIDWESYYQNENRKRVPLPTYPFEKKRYWFDEIIKNEKNPSIAASQKALLYVPTWTRDPDPLEENPTLDLNKKESGWIIFDNGSSISSNVITLLKNQQSPLWVVRPGNSYQSISSTEFLINPEQEGDYNSLIQEVIKGGYEQYGIIHFWPMNQPNLSDYKFYDSCLYEILYSGLFLAKAFYNKKKEAKFNCVMVSNQLQTVLGNESTEPLISSVLSLCRVFPLENNNYQFKSVDIDNNLTENLSILYAKHIIKKAFSSLHLHINQVVAYRHQYCWKIAYQVVENNSSKGVLIQPYSVYMITGGLGAMGLTIAEWLSTKAPCTVILLSRKDFPVLKEWKNWLETYGEEDKNSQIIKKLEKIIAQGTKVITVSADVANYTQMKQVISQIRKDHGQINGVFHLAGSPGEGLAVLKQVADFKKVLSPKIQGSWVLAQLLKKNDLEFFVSASSLTAVAGGVGQLDYCAANLFIDYFFAKQQFNHSKRSLTINWNAWSSIGMAASINNSRAHAQLYEENSVSPQEAINLLEQAMQTNYQQIIISRFEPSLESKRIAAAFDQSNKNESTLSDRSKAAEIDHIEVLKNIWKEALGVNNIEPEATFYSLGGDSLIAIQLLHQIDRRLNIDISLQEFIHVTTFDSLVKLIGIKPLKSFQTLINLAGSRGDTNPFAVYFIHPLGGTIFNYLSLLPYLNQSFEYYAFQDPELASGEMLFRSIGDMAKYYANQIIQGNKKSVILIGASFGGNLAMEMVAFLNAAGIMVKKVILIDSWANLAALNNIELSGQEAAEEISSLKSIQQYYGNLSYQYLTIKKRLSWLRSYTPSRVTAEVVLLAAEELLSIYRLLIKDSNNGWTPYCPDSIVKYAIQGNHDTMFHSTYLSNLGMKINKLIQS